MAGSVLWRSIPCCARLDVGMHSLAPLGVSCQTDRNFLRYGPEHFHVGALCYAQLWCARRNVTERGRAEVCR